MSRTTWVKNNMGQEHSLSKTLDTPGGHVVSCACQTRLTLIMSNNGQEIGSLLRDVRGGKGLTQGELAEMVGVSRQTINYLEQGTYCPSTKLALQLARALDVTVEDLFYLNDRHVKRPG
jgi:putative transcriptional regulator